MNKKQKRAVVDACIAAVGTLAELARRLKVEAPMIVNWRTRGVPAGWVLKLEAATEGKVTRHQIRPDLYPLEEVPKPATGVRTRQIATA